MAMSGGGHGLKPSFERLCRWPHKPRDLLKGSCSIQRQLSEKGKKKQLPDAELIMSNEQIRITKAVEKTITIFEFDSCGTEKCADNPARSYLILGVKAGQWNTRLCLIKLTLSQQFEMYGLHSNAERIERLAGQEANVTSTNLLQNAVKHQFGTMCSHFEKKLGKMLHVLTGMTKKAAATEKQKENAQLFEYARDVHKSLLIVLWQMHEIEDELKRFKGDMNGENGETAGHPPSSARSPTHDLFTNYESPRTLPRSYKERPRPPFAPDNARAAASAHDRSLLSVSSLLRPEESAIGQLRPPKHFAPLIQHSGGFRSQAVQFEQILCCNRQKLPCPRKKNRITTGKVQIRSNSQKPVPMPRSPPAIVLSEGPPSSSQPSLQELEAKVESLAVVKEESDSEFEEMDDLKVGRGTATSNQKIYQDLFEEESHYE
ncbi:hypothetical protein M3Y99_00618300 [Aphelenchoides fujianensis]|nr:hypothetical protein M3Y99_00618300 [Aphelenchoides fujianensis]